MTEPAASAPRLLALHGLRQIGTADADLLADHVGVEPTVFDGVFGSLLADGLVEERTGRFPGFRLTDAGRLEGEALVAAEVDALGCRADLEALHDRFEVSNDELLRICTAWQLKGEGVDAVPNDHEDEAYDAAVLADLAALHERVDPVLAGLAGLLGRMAGHRRRLAEALTAATAGDVAYVTSPRVRSYHGCWHELHEDLLVTLGRARP